MLGAIISNAALGFALDSGVTALSSVAVLGFIAYVIVPEMILCLTSPSSFAVGLGPVPYLMISELTPYYVSSLLVVAVSVSDKLYQAVSAMSSLSMAINCMQCEA
jgi:SP family facilitated glucose transporter-like MFS transporter 3